MSYGTVRLKIRSAFLNWTLAATAVLLCRVVFRTLRLRCVEADVRTNPYSGDGNSVIYCVWHDSILFPMFAGRHHPNKSVALVSKHQDGSFLGHGLKMLGIGLVRGSSSRAGAAAMREMLNLPANKHVVLTPDGPRGPRRRTKLGLVFLAAHSGRAIVPSAFAAAKCWRLPGTWTDLAIPKPFTTVYAMTGKPISVPHDATREALLAIEVVVQSEMDRLSDEAERLAHRTPSVNTRASLSVRAAALRV